MIAKLLRVSWFLIFVSVRAKWALGKEGKEGVLPATTAREMPSIVLSNGGSLNFFLLYSLSCHL